MRRLRTAVAAGLAVLVGGVGGPVSATPPSGPDGSGERVVEHVEVDVGEGVLLRGHVVRPAGSSRDPVPVVLWSSP